VQGLLHVQAWPEQSVEHLREFAPCSDDPALLIEQSCGALRDAARLTGQFMCSIA